MNTRPYDFQRRQNFPRLIALLFIVVHIHLNSEQLP